MPVPGYAGKILRVDLTNERLSEEVLDEATLRKWVGGVGIGAKYLYEEVPPHVQWNDPENRLIIMSGPLGGTRIGGSGTISVITRGTLTGGATSTQANGYLAAYMKFSGYDGIIVQGAAKDWKYLYLHGGTAELRDARHLVGLGIWETEDAIKKELGASERAMSVFGIGPAGENLVRFAAISGDKDHTAGHNGTGAVMGFKKLKAIAAARGRSAVAVKERPGLSKKADEIWEAVQEEPLARWIFEWGTGGSYERAETRTQVGTLPIKNYTTNLYPASANRAMTSQYTRERWSAKRDPCWACIQHHCHMITFTDGPYAGRTVVEPEYEAFAAWGPLIGNTDTAECLMMAWTVDNLGFETNEAGFLMSMVIELYEKGAITKEDTEGLELTWGNAPAIKELLNRIAHRQGRFANILAEGTMRAAEALGEEAQNCGIYIKKGLSPRGHDHRAMWREMFDTATSSNGTYESGVISNVRDIGMESAGDPFNPDDVSTLTAKAKGRRQFEDTLGTCTFCTRVALPHLTDALNLATGWNFTPQEAQEVGFRAANLLRAFNIRCGITPEVEYPSSRYWSAPVDGPAQGISVEPVWEQMLENFYRLMGWDRQSGRPYPETLRALGLEEVVKDIWEVEPAR